MASQEIPPASNDDLLELLVLDGESGVAPFRQLHEAVVRGVSEGRILPGQRLPPIRALATRLGLAVNTAAAAYRSLEEAGVVEGRGRAGTFVSDGGRAALGEDPVSAAARGIALEAARRLRELGLEPASAHEVLAEAVEAVAASR